MKTKLTPLALVLASVTLAHASPEGAAPKFTVHEWGTFTSVSTSDGRLLAGVEAEEESLPPFVRAHDGMSGLGGSPFTKGWRRPLANVTVRMETPVLYFYTEQPFRATVDVGFKGGSISQWYPDRSGGETPPSVRDADGNLLPKLPTLDFAVPYEGSIRWNVDVIPAPGDALGRIFKPHETASWLYPRQTDSALVRDQSGETEKYLFYRGVGNVKPPVTFRAQPGGAVRASFDMETKRGEMLVFQNEKGNGRWITESSGHPTPTVSLGTAELRADWRRGVYEDAAGMLVRAGLFRKEADAMLQTWWTSYFEREGTRVFWIAPAAHTDRVLPLKVEPAPQTTVRVMVGRTEILTPEFEARLVADFTAAEKEGQSGPWTGDRFYPAYAQRVKEIRSGLAKQ